MEIADNLIRSGAIDIVVVDSVAALTPKSEIEAERWGSSKWASREIDVSGTEKINGYY